jgi:hypothetical protein
MEKHWRFLGVAAAWALFIVGSLAVGSWARGLANANWKYLPLYIAVAMIIVAAWTEFLKRPPRP